MVICFPCLANRHGNKRTFASEQNVLIQGPKQPLAYKRDKAIIGTFRGLSENINDKSYTYKETNDYYR